MKRCVGLSLFIYLVLFIQNGTVTCEINGSPPAEKQKTLKYDIVKHTEGHMRLQLILGGSAYTENKKCRIMKSKEDLSVFEEIVTCDNQESDINGKCVRKCKTEKFELKNSEASLRTKYIYIFDGSTKDEVKEADQTKGGVVFGLPLVALINPIITLSVDNSKKLKFATKTCPQVACPIKYDTIQYVAGTAAADCTSDNSANSVEFDLLLPHYEMKCVNLPSFFYYMPNEYMRSEIDAYRPQFYVAYKSATMKTKYMLKFQNKLSSEICLFSIKSGFDNESANQYESKCGGENNQKCYAPCNNIELTIDQTKAIVNVLIQTREHDITKTGDGAEGFKAAKFAIIDSDPGLLSSETKDGVTFNTALFNPQDAGDNKFTACTLKHYPADKPKLTEMTDTKCNTDTTTSDKCKTDCTSLVIEQLANGKPFMIEIAPTAIANADNFKEYIFIRTLKKDAGDFLGTILRKTETSFSLKPIDGTPSTGTNEPTCAYFISPAGRDAYYEAECEDTNPCRGLCKKEKTILNLEVGTSYDIKVIAHKDYAIKEYTNQTTSLSILTLKSKFTTTGFTVIGQLSTDYPLAKCQYVVQVKNNEKFENVYACTDVLEPSPPSPPEAPKSIHIARAVATEEGAGNSSTIPTCESLPLCSLITFDKDYDASKEYKVTVTAVGKSEETEITIPANLPPVNPTDTSKIILVTIIRDGDNLKITTVLPGGKGEKSRCKWEIRNTNAMSKHIVKSCMKGRDTGCNSFPPCKEFTIKGVPDTNDYHVTVVHSIDPSIIGVAEIEKGQSGTAQSSTTTIAVVIVVIAAVVGLGGAGFYFGYWKKRN